MENLFREDNPSIISSDQIDVHPRGLQKRGRRK
jgi:hypothetical protein